MMFQNTSGTADGISAHLSQECMAFRQQKFKIAIGKFQTKKVSLENQ